MVQRQHHLTRELEDVQKGVTCPSCGFKRVHRKTRQEGEERPRQCVRSESTEATPYTDDRSTERRAIQGFEIENAMLGRMSTGVQIRRLPQREWIKTLRYSIYLQRSPNAVGAPPFIGLLHTGVRQGLRWWACRQHTKMSIVGEQ